MAHKSNQLWFAIWLIKKAWRKEGRDDSSLGCVLFFFILLVYAWN